MVDVLNRWKDVIFDLSVQMQVEGYEPYAPEKGAVSTAPALPEQKPAAAILANWCSGLPAGKAPLQKVLAMNSFDAKPDRSSGWFCPWLRRHEARI